MNKLSLKLLMSENKPKIQIFNCAIICNPCKQTGRNRYSLEDLCHTEQVFWTVLPPEASQCNINARETSCHSKCPEEMVTCAITCSLDRNFSSPLDVLKLMPVADRGRSKQSRAIWRSLVWNHISACGGLQWFTVLSIQLKAGVRIMMRHRRGSRMPDFTLLSQSETSRLEAFKGNDVPRTHPVDPPLTLAPGSCATLKLPKCRTHPIKHVFLPPRTDSLSSINVQHIVGHRSQVPESNQIRFTPLKVAVQHFWPELLIFRANI